MILDRLITVCDACLTAYCWQGEFMCERARNAGTVEKSVRELRALGAGEHAEYWFKDPSTGRVDALALAKFEEAA